VAKLRNATEYVKHSLKCVLYKYSAAKGTEDNNMRREEKKRKEIMIEVKQK
jgi:hypothetical protein